MTSPTETFLSGNSVDLMKPELAEDEVKTILKNFWNIDEELHKISTIPSYDDQNFIIVTKKNEILRKLVLKISHNQESYDILQLQNSLMQELNDKNILSPVPVNSIKGNGIEQYTKDEKCTHFVRLLTYIEGTMQADIPSTLKLMKNVGKFVGEMDNALKDFSSPAASRNFSWDLANLPMIDEHLHAIKLDHRKMIVTEALKEFSDKVLPIYPNLRNSVVHNDANNRNIIMNEKTSEVVGVIDFGDVVYTKTVFNCAITIGYAMLSASDYASFGESVLLGYCEAFPLNETELEVVFLLSLCRLVQSVIFSSLKQLDYPDDEYIAIDQKPAWVCLETLWSDRERIGKQWKDAVLKMSNK